MIDTIRYDTRCYFNVRSKADISQLSLPQIWLKDETQAVYKTNEAKLVYRSNQSLNFTACCTCLDQMVDHIVECLNVVNHLVRLAMILKRLNSSC